MIEAYATLRHYEDHLSPIWTAIDASQRGAFWVAGSLGDLPAIPNKVWARRVGHPAPSRQPILTMVAGWQDEVTLAKLPGLGRPVVYLEHGAGQTYVTPDGPHGSYSGSPGHERAALFLCPNRQVAERWSQRYPGTPAAVVGCPKLDWWHTNPGAGPRPDSPPTCAITFHSDNRLCPETLPAFKHYEDQLGRVVNLLRGKGVTVIGHAHPRLFRTLEKYWQTIGVQPVEDFDQVMMRAHVLCVDNSSVGPEFASTGRPIVWLNAPWYRRDISHGGRFWDWTEGIVCADGPDELPDAVLEALADAPERREARQKMVASVYAYTDGECAARAAAAVEAVHRTIVPDGATDTPYARAR